LFTNKLHLTKNIGVRFAGKRSSAVSGIDQKPGMLVYFKCSKPPRTVKEGSLLVCAVIKIPKDQSHIAQEVRIVIILYINANILTYPQQLFKRGGYHARNDAVLVIAGILDM
jgi:hypothetical protein